MTNNNHHPITPPPELVEKWAFMFEFRTDTEVFTDAGQWFADQELEACCEWFVRDWTDIETADKLRAARRPKPPSLKEQALTALNDASARLDAMHENIIRRALEKLDD